MEVLSPSSKVSTPKISTDNYGLNDNINQLELQTKQIKGLVDETKKLIEEYEKIKQDIDSESEPKWSISLRTQIDTYLNALSKLTIQLQQLGLDFQTVVRKIKVGGISNDLLSPKSSPGSPVRGRSSNLSATVSKRNLFQF